MEFTPIIGLDLDKTIEVNGYATTRVPLEARKSTFEVSMVAAGFCIAMSGLFTGASMAAGLSLKQAILAALVGNAILSFFGFRYKSVFFGNTINAMFPGGGILTNVQVAAFWGGILMLLTAYYGFKGLSALSIIAVPLLVITSTIAIFMAIKGSGGWDVLVKNQVVGSVTITQGIVMVVGSFAAGASAQADITRYAKDEKASWISTFFGYMIANSFIILAGYLTTFATGEGDLPRAMLSLGLGIPALFVLIAAQ